MALKIDFSYVEEDIVDKKGNVIGKIKFDPDDEKIMKKMSDILKDLTDRIKMQKDIGKINNIEKIDSNSIEDFENALKDILKLNNTIDIEYYAIENAIKSFSDIFGKETMDIITGGSVSIKNLIPLIEFITPYVEKSRKKYKSKYLKNDSSDFE